MIKNYSFSVVTQKLTLKESTPKKPFETDLKDSEVPVNRVFLRTLLLILQRVDKKLKWHSILIRHFQQWEQNFNPRWSLLMQLSIKLFPLKAQTSFPSINLSLLPHSELDWWTLCIVVYSSLERWKSIITFSMCSSSILPWKAQGLKLYLNTFVTRAFA